MMTEGKMRRHEVIAVLVFALFVFWCGLFSGHKVGKMDQWETDKVLIRVLSDENKRLKARQPEAPNGCGSNERQINRDLHEKVMGKCWHGWMYSFTRPKCGADMCHAVMHADNGRVFYTPHAPATMRHSSGRST